MKKLLYSIYSITGGRPMKRVQYCFYDAIGRRDIHEYIDGFGRRWTAHSAWAWYRVRIKDNGRDSQASVQIGG